jgi:hypothetical protein
MRIDRRAIVHQLTHGNSERLRLRLSLVELSMLGVVLRAVEERISNPKVALGAGARRAKQVHLDLPGVGTMRAVAKAVPDCDLYDTKAIDLAIDRVSGIGSPTNALDAWRMRRASWLI